jgi:hypothetical protein
MSSLLVALVVFGCTFGGAIRHRGCDPVFVRRRRDRVSAPFRSSPRRTTKRRRGNPGRAGDPRVALGVVVTALVQSLLGGIGLAIAGVPFAMVLTAIMFLLSTVQIGPLPVLVTCVG